MKTSEIRVGTRLELEIMNSLGKKIGLTYISQLLDVIDAQEVLVSCPIYESQFVFIAAGSKVKIIFFNEKYGLLSFIASVTTREKRGNIFCLSLKIISDFEKIQRRKYFRMDCLLKSFYRLVDNEKPQAIHSSSDEKPLKKALAKNISGSGACLVIDHNVDKDSLLEIRLSLNDTTEIKAICSVLRIVEMESGKIKKYELGLYFKEISSKDQDAVIKYIFEQQRQMLKKNIIDR